MTDRRWELLEVARPLLLSSFASSGVTRIEFVAAFPMSKSLSVWLCTETDRERDAIDLTESSKLVGAALAQVGLDQNDLDAVTVVAQSQETVDRDYDGSWFYALR